MWLKRETKQTSVTLTFVTISFVLYSSACIAHALNLISHVSEFNQIFYACLASYVGRKMSFKTKSISVNQSDESEKEKEE